jgi:hypothetical protein
MPRTAQEHSSGGSRCYASCWRLTLRYASPEQIKGERLTTATDIYSLGVILYELLTGASPHGADTHPPSLMHAILHKDPVQPRHASPGALPRPGGDCPQGPAQGSGINRLQTAEQFTHGRKLVGGATCGEFQLAIAVALGGELSAGVVGQRVLHYCRCRQKEVPAILQLGAPAVGEQAKKAFMHKAGSRERMVHTLPGHDAARDKTKFRVDATNQLIKRQAVAIGVFREQGANVALDSLLHVWSQVYRGMQG